MREKDHRGHHLGVLLMVPMLALFLTIVQAAGVASAQSPQPLIKEARLEVTIEDSGSYLVYRYRLVNSAQSRSAIAGFNLSLSAPKGTGLNMLPSTAGLFDGARVGIGPITDHVPVGVISPDGWSAAVMSNAIVTWGPFQGYVGSANGTAITITRDSAPAGGSKAGFGLRSPYLPGLRRFSAEPTLGSCCAQLKPGSGEYPAQGEFRARGSTVAPTVAPESMTVEIVRTDLEEVCGALRWVPDGAVCDRLRSRLRGQPGQSPKDALRMFLHDLESQHGLGRPVNNNAYWLLKVNGEYLIRRL